MIKDNIFVIFCAIFCGIANASLPFVINTWDYEIATSKSWSTLKKTGNSLEAVVEGISGCEKHIDRCNFKVGYGGSPDELGETSLDAMILDGSSLNMGAVANVRSIRYPIKVAKHVLLHTDHSILAGEEATEFAVKMGFKRESFFSNNSKQIHSDWINNNCQPNYWNNVTPDPRKSCGPYKANDNLSATYNFHKNRIDNHSHDTIGMVVINEKGSIFTGTSTNGLTHKIAGRVGDAPIPGSGSYCNDQYGAAVCTGNGDITMRHLPTFLAVEFLRNGLSPKEAADKVRRRILDRYQYKNWFALIVVDKDGNYAAVCHDGSGYRDHFPYTVADEKGLRVETVICSKNKV
ncbi:AGA.2 family protein [Megaselia abdita]